MRACAGVYNCYIVTLLLLMPLHLLWAEGIALERDSQPVSYESSLQPVTFPSLSTPAASQFLKDKPSDASSGFTCMVNHDWQAKGKVTLPSVDNNSLNDRSNINIDHKIYRLAITTTGEFSQQFGGDAHKTLEAVKKIVKRVNEVFLRDTGIIFELVHNNEALIFLDPDADPFVNHAPSHIVTTNQKVVDAIIGKNNYDIGHVFSTSGGGLAYTGGVCDDEHKAMGLSAINNPKGERFSFDFFAHELGHQLGATHTFNGLGGLCSAGHRDALSSVEPGSGSSIMSYAGYCASDNIQYSVDSMFHYHSILQIKQFMWNGAGAKCGIRKANKDIAPVIELKDDFYVPARTPITLTGKVRDHDSKELLYAWHQMDSGIPSALSEDKGNNALIRARLPQHNTDRTIPPLKSLLAGVYELGETLPSSDREMNIMFTAYDGKNVSSEALKLFVIDSGRAFGFTNTPASIKAGGEYRLQWDSAETELPPIACSAVDIHLSDNNGESFDYVLAESIANNGEANVRIPEPFTLRDSFRFKLQCSDNIFFSISNSNNDLANRGENSVSKSNETQETSEVAQASGFSGYLLWLFVLLVGSSKLLRRVNTRLTIA